MLEASKFRYLPISEGNHLVSTGSKSSQRKGMDNDDDYYDEVTPDGDVVAKYHTWHHMSIYPPQRVSEGWEKLDLDGKKIDSGSCK
ncbi:hypothetical protein [Shewanella sp. SR43-8]|uniref:hypothetical protein n=1 Tax=Shewanella sp. SR43-8 TaxID=2760938 RepID=UPI0016027A3E|nr:hypothetical protein [Shewanella sp. SR43-8]MBB1320594.1 hypothetical protein [Shewanella sp. SR43-8]